MSALPEVLTLTEASQHGLTPRAVKHRIATGRWQRVFPRVYVTYSGPVAQEHRLTAALAYAGEGAALSHGTAAVRHGLPGASADLIHLVVPATRRVAPQPRLKIHYSRDLPAGDRRSVRGLWCTSVERTVLDLARVAPSAGTAADVLANAVSSGRTTSARLRSIVESRRCVPYRAELLEVLTETEAGARSPLELRHAHICRDHGLPVGARQLRQLLEGRVTYVDDFLEEFGIVTELDRRQGHELAADRFRDQRRDNANTVVGRAVLRVGWRAALDEPCEVARRRAALLRHRGWRGIAHPCGPSCTVDVPFESIKDALAPGNPDPRRTVTHPEAPASARC